MATSIDADTGSTDDSENITLELELEHEVPSPNDTSQNHFQKASDGISRRFYSRIFTYSADYPEKCVEILWS
jgi:hypothetical protein